jgi:hypothetical protein
VNRVHRLLSELVPGRSKRDITTGQARRILATVRPRDVAGKTRRRLAAEQIDELVAIEKKVTALTRELKEMVLATGSRLMELPGVGPVVAARTLADVGDVARFADRNRYASRTGTARRSLLRGGRPAPPLPRREPPDEPHDPHRRHHPDPPRHPGRAYYRRKLAAGKTRAEAMRCLKRRISDALYRQLRTDARAAGNEAGPGGHRGAALQSSAAGLHPHTGTSDQPLPGPAPTTLPAPTSTRKSTTSSPMQPAS